MQIHRAAQLAGVRTVLEVRGLSKRFGHSQALAECTFAVVGGATVLFSSHQLDLVQHLCQDIVTIDHGRVVVAGSLERLQATAGRRHIDIVFAAPPGPGWYSALRCTCGPGADDRHVRLAVSNGSDPAVVLRAATAAGPLLSFSFQPPSLEEMFPEAIGQ